MAVSEKIVLRRKVREGMSSFVTRLSEHCFPCSLNRLHRKEVTRSVETAVVGGMIFSDGYSFSAKPGRWHRGEKGWPRRPSEWLNWTSSSSGMLEYVGGNSWWKCVLVRSWKRDKKGRCSLLFFSLDETQDTCFCVPMVPIFHFRGTRKLGTQQTRSRKIEKFQLGATRKLRTCLRKFATSFFDSCRRRSQFEETRGNFESQMASKNGTAQKFLLLIGWIKPEYQFRHQIC